MGRNSPDFPGRPHSGKSSVLKLNFGLIQFQARRPFHPRNKSSNPNRNPALKICCVLQAPPEPLHRTSPRDERLRRAWRAQPMHKTSTIARDQEYCLFIRALERWLIFIVP
jgi:hypothetical protein